MNGEMLLQNFLDPIARVWGRRPLPNYPAQRKSRISQRKKIIKKVTKT